MADLRDLVNSVSEDPDFIGAEIIAGNIDYFVKEAREYFAAYDNELILADDETSYCIKLFYLKTSVKLSGIVFLANAIFRQISTATPETFKKLSYIVPTSISKYAATMSTLSSCLNFLSIGVGKELEHAVASVSEIMQGSRQYQTVR